MSPIRAAALVTLAATLMGVAGTTAGASGAAGASGGVGASGPAVAGAALLPAIERQVMCVTCKIPLNVAFSPQAERERAFIRELIAQGRDEPQIKRALVFQYGEAVLGLPRAHGFDLAVYLIPLAVIAALLGLVALLLPRWRRRTRLASPRPTAPQLSPSESARLEADMERFD
jgi:cytochrome c-type biogenesis protein CcmH/NrfF